MAFIAENPPAQRACKPQGSYKRVLRGQVAVDQLMRAFLSHTHYWCELGMLKVPNIFKVYIREKEMARTSTNMNVEQQWYLQTVNRNRSNKLLMKQELVKYR